MEGMTTRAHAVDVLKRVQAGTPLSSADAVPVKSLILLGHMTVNPVHDPKDPCPYLLTDKGRRAVARHKAGQ